MFTPFYIGKNGPERKSFANFESILR